VKVALLFAVGVLGVGGDRATAAPTANGVSIRLHYLMTCGQPGRGPIVVTLPAAFRIASARATVRGVARATSVNGDTISIALAKPPEVTCMSITQGVLPVTLTGVHAPSGTYTLRVRVNTHAFAVRLRV
jgi:hypothetical protein